MNSQLSRIALQLILVILLASCASAPPAPVRVEIPVFTPCVEVVPQRPAYEFDQLRPSASDGELVLALARDWPRGRKYEGELEAIIEGCLSVASPPSAPAGPAGTSGTE